MKCEHCGQEIKKLTNFDRLKARRNKEEVHELSDKLCEKSLCPFQTNYCPDNGNSKCLFDVLGEWLFKEAE